MLVYDINAQGPYELISVFSQYANYIEILSSQYERWYYTVLLFAK